MTVLLLSLVVTSGAFLLRLAGLTLPIRQFSPGWEQFFQLLPISIFAALIVSALYAQPDPLNLKIIALAVTGGVAWRTRQFGLCILVGLIVLWVLTSLASK